MLECGAARRDGSSVSPCHSGGLDLSWFTNQSLVASCGMLIPSNSFTLDEHSGELTVPKVQLSLNGTTFTCFFIRGGHPAKSRTTLLVRRGECVARRAHRVTAPERPNHKYK